MSACLAGGLGRTGGEILGNSNWRYREDIDGLRALAVVAVILFHFESSWFPGGFVGVDVFFVISGFLITSLIARQITEDRFSLIDFYERRFRRIYPNLLIVLAVTVVLGFVAMVPLTYRPFGRSLVWATLSASNFAFIGGDGYFDPDNLTKPLLHTWSLGVEEQFYLVFPWLLILAAKRGYSAKWLIGAVVAISLALSIGAAFANWAPSYFLLPTRFWELGIGALIAIRPPSNRLSSTQRSILGIAGLLAIAWAALRLSDADPFPGYLALAPTLGAAATIWANGGLASHLLSFRPFVWIGRLSFALYLWHWPLISIAAGIGLPPTGTATRLLITTVMLVLSVAGYFLWEQPIRQRRRLGRRKKFFAVLAVFAVVLVGIGVVIFETRGLPQRLPADLVAIDEAAKRDSFFITKRCPEVESIKPAPCTIGDETTNKVSFVIIGDSQAQAVAAEIGDLAKSYHLRGLYLGKIGCPPLAGLTRTRRSHCSMQYDFAMNEIRENNPELVIALMHWAGLIGDPVGGPKTPLLKQGEVVTEADRSAVVTAALDETLTNLGNRQIVTSLTIPEHNGKALLFGKWWTERFGFPMFVPRLTLSEYWERQTYVKRLLSDAQLRHANLTVVSPAPVFCPTDLCIQSTNDTILYSDDSHLSHAGAQLYAPLFEAALAKMSATIKRPNPSLPSD
ncbi:acyltransferase family protein [uncultured Pleomorphomonas sp.]|uniref:acyltransferase family protein n=1 Tax=uncultured Pleomorphomonas sp. TaxID=442121 RepID=UPI002588E816|nr:acyltransferase family protein [uncultured Pleomorphomonas sp.]